MDKINRLNKTKAFLALGVFSAAVSAALWAWMWHYRGLSGFNPGPERVAALALTVANAILWIAYWLINQYYLQFFALTHPFPIQAYDSRYVHNWRMAFLEPFLLLLQLGMFLFWLASLTCLILRRRVTAQASALF